MIEKFRFYATHSINDLMVNGQRTLFALLCIAAGVAAIVSLQTTGVMIENSLTTSLQEANQGDIRIRAELPFAISDEGKAQVGSDGLIQPGEQFQDVFTANGLEKIQTWLDENYPGQAEMLYRASVPFTQTAISAHENGTSNPFAFPFIVDAARFPFYGEIRTADGMPLSEAITEPNHIVVSQKIAEDLGVGIGDEVLIGGAVEHFEVTGIIEDTGGAVGGDFGVAILGYYFLDMSALDFFADIKELQANVIYIRLNEPERAVEITDALLDEYSYLNTVNTEDLREQNESLSSAVNDLVSVMGLLAMLIGGIGIINTMQVIVRRRTVEVAVLKTIGLQGGQVTTLFLVEAFIMGVIGSIIGLFAGWGLTFVFKGVAESITGPLPFKITPGPAITGIVVGILVTTVFGFLPTLSAGRIRPGLVLRPTDTTIPKAGRLQSILALLLVVVVVAIIAAGFIGLIAAAVVPGAFIAVGVLYVLLSLLIWVVGRFFPTFGSVDLKVSLRSMLAGRSRAATTLLALVIGVFVLSVITLLTGTVLAQFQKLIELDTGGNVIVVGLTSSSQTQEDIEKVLDQATGVESFSSLSSYSVRPVQIEHVDGSLSTWEEVRQRIEELGPLTPGFAPPEDDPTAPRLADLAEFSFSAIDARDVTSNLPDLPFYAGRQLNESDAGQPHIVISRDNFNANAGIDIGDKIMFTFENARLAAFGISDPNAKEMTYEVVGIIDKTSGIPAGFTAAIYASSESFPEGVVPSSVSAVAAITEPDIPTVRAELQEIPGVLVIETKTLNELINSLVDQFTSFPILVAALSLLVGGIVIANSVALTTMERRREIAVMKAVGLQRERVLGMLLLENGLMGIIGGIIGVGIGLIVLIAVLQLSFPNIDTFGSIPFETAILLMLLCVAISMGAAMLAAWNASGEKPLNVLRYE